MSQTTLPEQPPTSSPQEEHKRKAAEPPLVSADLQSYELDYKPMPLTAPVALFLGLSAFMGLMGLFGLVLAAVGVLVSIGSVLQIKASKGQYSGQALAIIGGALSAVFLAAGSYMMASDYKAELPPGYSRVNFPREIAEKQFVMVDGQREIHPDVKPFVDQPIFVKGWIWESATYDSGFVLLKDNGKCCFGGNPAPHDMIEVRLEPGTSFQYISGLVAVAGVLRADPQAPLGAPVYVMEAKHVAKAKTVF